MAIRLAVLGDGAWGTAMAILLARQPDHEVRLWSARAENGAAIRTTRRNDRFLPGVSLPDRITPTTDPAEAVDGADLWFTAVPTVYLRTTVERFRPWSGPHVRVVSLTKGIELSTFRRPSEILEEVLGTDQTTTLSGPTHAEEVCRGMPTSAVVAGRDEELTRFAQRCCSSDRFRVYTNADLIGVEIAGALKNVIGIAAGIGDGLNFGDNAKSALLTRAIVEMTRFGTAFGADPSTFAGLAGIGDLITTCFSKHGRNRRVGELLGQGRTREEITAGTPTVAEGVTTAKAVHDRVVPLRLEMPICQGVYRVLYENRSPEEVLSSLMARKSGSERIDK